MWIVTFNVVPAKGSCAKAEKVSSPKTFLPSVRPGVALIGKMNARQNNKNRVVVILILTIPPVIPDAALQEVA
jgi:hypothetical protein